MNKFNHLFHLKNTEENRGLIKSLNKNMKEHNSKHGFRIKYRKPKPGHKWGWGGTISQKNADEFAIYLKGSGVDDAERLNYNKQLRELNRRNFLLMDLIYHMDTSISREIESVIERFRQKISNKAFAINSGENDAI